MLERLHVRDLALIDDLRFEPGPGLNLITGETGSGKSILLDALGFVVGARASADLIRSQAEVVQVSAEFAPHEEWIRRRRPWFEEKGLAWGEGSLFLKRELNRNGKGRAWINGEPVPVGVLAELGQALVDFHGQHDHQSLLRVSEHRGTLDRFGALEEDVARVEAAWEEVQRRRQALEGPSGDPSARGRQLEFLEFQVQELQELAPREGEWEALKASASLQANAGKRADALARASAGMVSEEDGALPRLEQALAALRRLAEMDPRQVPIFQQVERALLDLKDAAEGVRALQDSLELDPAELERLQRRLHDWEKLSHKHRCPAEELPAAAAALARDRDALRDLLQDEAGLRAALEKAREAYAAEAQALSAARDKAGAKLIKALTRELQELIGPTALFTVRIALREDPSGPFRVAGRQCRGDASGVDEVEFLFAPNPGEAPKPLARIASGGELSRVALALKTVFSRREGAPCLVFDEIDAGISGRVAAVVGAKIGELARKHQVLCITHLPQIASLAGRHFRVSKRMGPSATVTTVEVLDLQGREGEVAALLGGGEAGSSAAAHARELLARSADLGE